MNKNHITKTIFMLALSMTIVMTSCKKSTPDTTPSVSTAPTTPSPGDADGVVAAVAVDATTTTLGMTVPLTIGVAIAAFGNTSAEFLAGTYTDAGSVSCNSQSLTKVTGNSYIYQPAATSTSATGIDFSPGISWNISGAGSVPTFTRSLGNVMPTAPSVSSSKTVTRGSDYTMTINSISNADSIIFVIASGSVMLTKTLDGSATSCTFTGAETNTLPASSSALIQVDPFNYTFEIISGKKIYFVNESSYNLVGAKVE